MSAYTLCGNTRGDPHLLGFFFVGIFLEFSITLYWEWFLPKSSCQCLVTFASLALGNSKCWAASEISSHHLPHLTGTGIGKVQRRIMRPCVPPDLRVLAAALNSLGHHKAVIERTQLQELEAKD